MGNCIKSADANRDGKVSLEEAAEFVGQIIQHIKTLQPEVQAIEGAIKSSIEKLN